MKKKILVVDFDQNFQKTLSAIFPEDGFELFFAESADTAKAMLNAQKIDLLITEAMLPKQSGFELALEARAQFPELITIIVSGVYKGLLFRHQAISEFKATDFFEKPVNVGIFRDRVFELLNLIEQDTVVEKVPPEKGKRKQKEFVLEETNQLLLNLIEGGGAKKKEKHSADNLKRNSYQNQEQLASEPKPAVEVSKQTLPESSEKKTPRKSFTENITAELETIKPESKVEKKKYIKIDEDVNRKIQEIIADLSNGRHSKTDKRRSKKE